mmetsp:Transcript_23818/g.33326  ORF Transcript_23818/g.33326 Transcript_23818/m.33326 type:complete len:223 (+) Transcript_23818:104-772(+)
MGDTETLLVHAWVSEVYNVVVEAAMQGKVQDLVHQIEDIFSEALQFGLKILALQDPNHNDLPPTCKVNLVLKNLDKVFVVVHPKSLRVPAAPRYSRKQGRRQRRLFTHAFGETRDENSPSEGKKRLKRSRDVAACFTNYFKLREMLRRPRSVTALIKSSHPSKDQSDKANFIEDQLILTRIRMISEELEDKLSDGASSSQGLSEIVDRLPHGFEYMICRWER